MSLRNSKNEVNLSGKGSPEQLAASWKHSLGADLQGAAKFGSGRVSCLLKTHFIRQRDVNVLNVFIKSSHISSKVQILVL